MVFDYITDRLRGIDFVEEHELRDEILQIITRSKVREEIMEKVSNKIKEELKELGYYYR